MNEQDPGRSCPLHYRYRATRLCRRAARERCEVLYVVGGLYGNVQALQRVIELFERERGDKRLVFNGDFHWFDVDAEAFAQIQRGVLAFDATRGNVETELAAAPSHDGDRRRLRLRLSRLGRRRRGRALEPHPHAAARHRAPLPGACDALQALPMWRRIDVGATPRRHRARRRAVAVGLGLRAGDAARPRARAWPPQWFAQAQVDVFASSHTCLPVFQALRRAESASDAPLVLNNGAAGMPNLAG